MSEPTKSYPGFVTLSFSRRDAMRISSALEDAVHKLPALSDDAIALKNLSNEIFEGLVPWLTYKLKCKDCPRIFDYKTKVPLSEESIKAGGICAGCSEDYQ